MNLAAVIVIFIMVWWITLFAVLPLKVQQVEYPESGHDRGAPQKPHIKLKMFITTGIAIVITAAYVFLATYGYLDFLKIRED
jgi:predicted secreted protein